MILSADGIADLQPGEILEFYHYVQPKPRRTLEELLEDYCYQTDEGKWRPPLTEEEKKAAREASV